MDFFNASTMQSCSQDCDTQGAHLVIWCEEVDTIVNSTCVGIYLEKMS